MYWKDKATLVQMEQVPTPDGYKETREARREVYCNRKSATRAEFYAAKQAGDRLALVLEVRGADYQGETRVEFAGKPYEVVRDYTKNGEFFVLNCKEAEVEGNDAEQHPESGA